MKKVLVTGSEGFVGRYLVEELLERNFIVEGTYFDPKPQYKIKTYFMDIRKKEEIENILNNDYDIIFHLAAQSSGAIAYKEVSLTYEINTNGTLNLLNTLRMMNKDIHFIYVSTAEVYGIPKQLPLKETDICVPVNHYATSKYNAENIVRVFGKTYSNIKITILRPFNHTGPYQREIFVMPSFAKQIVAIEKGEQEPILKTGDLSIRRDFMDVKDVVKAYTLVAQKGVKGVYNVSSGKSYSIKELLDKMRKISDINIKVEIDPKKLRPIDIADLYGDSRSIYDAVGWKPKIDIEQTLQELLNYWRSK